MHCTSTGVQCSLLPGGLHDLQGPRSQRPSDALLTQQQHPVCPPTRTPTKHSHLPWPAITHHPTPLCPDDPHLIHWRKDPVPFLPLPPASMDLTGWRDPFVVERPCATNNHEWVVLIGSGIKNVGGTAVVYRTRDLRMPSSWQFDGLLCSGDGGTGGWGVHRFWWGRGCSSGHCCCSLPGMSLILSWAG
jgi:hypothetical protein